jgi:hypothetical protein
MVAAAKTAAKPATGDKKQTPWDAMGLTRHEFIREMAKRMKAARSVRPTPRPDQPLPDVGLDRPGMPKFKN